MKLFGVDKYNEKEDYIVFPTICHNINTDTASMKLYYYKESKTFHCYTQCAKTFDIYGLFIKVYSTRNRTYNFYEDIVEVILSNAKINPLIDFDRFKYQSIKNKYKKKNREVELKESPEGVLNVFTKTYPEQWLEEGINKETLDKFNILFSISQNKIIIPHYDLKNRLIGIRGRALNPEEIEAGCKYMPVKIENKWYTHSLSLNLYGINFNADAIRKTKKVILFEGEKSVMLYNSYFKENNSLAVCGSSFNKLQLDLLIKNFEIEEITIAFDKEYDTYNSKQGQDYYQKIADLCHKYQNYCNFSFIFDRDNLIKQKDSPIDCGKNNFIELYKKRIKI